ncbi:hypothetical protein [Candidatus Bathycorpusculum sp.]|jgi:hypothetical protein|uniref:hypothetical protein n=1 Tax=Candidatus Bathycorpusculum sp. TaxID=2994959 RepID=UPI0028303B53|nr:hypothetical protein [Candidatus Termitimicrobium sp.]MCL2432396.1 hypothetical protein [Candidatus Termitimicrobium sp.]
MTSRLKTFGLIALIGFIAGVLVQVTATYVIPWLVEVLPSLAKISPFLIAGFAGAILTVAGVCIWAYVTGNRNTY